MVITEEEFQLIITLIITLILINIILADLEKKSTAIKEANQVKIINVGLTRPIDVVLLTVWLICL